MRIHPEGCPYNSAYLDITINIVVECPENHKTKNMPVSQYKYESLCHLLLLIILNDVCFAWYIFIYSNLYLLRK